MVSSRSRYLYFSILLSGVEGGSDVRASAWRDEGLLPEVYEQYKTISRDPSAEGKIQGRDRRPFIAY